MASWSKCAWVTSATSVRTMGISRMYHGGYMPTMSLRQGSTKTLTPLGDSICTAMLP